MLAPSAHSKSVLSYCHRLASTKPKRTTLATQLSVSVCSVTRDFNEQPHLHESERVLFRHNTMSALSQHVVGMAAVRPARSMISLLRSQQAGCSCSAPTSQLASLPVPRRVRSQKASRQQRPAALEQSAPGSTLSSELRAALDKFIAEHQIVLFMKGNKQFPQCGFSNTCVQIFNMMNVPYETVNILEDDSLRMGMKEYSQWPTFPQVYIDGEFYGGCDIMIESFQSGELQEMLEASLNS